MIDCLPPPSITSSTGATSEPRPETEKIVQTSQFLEFEPLSSQAVIQHRAVQLDGSERASAVVTANYLLLDGNFTFPEFCLSPTMVWQASRHDSGFCSRADVENPTQYTVRTRSCSFPEHWARDYTTYRSTEINLTGQRTGGAYLLQVSEFGVRSLAQKILSIKNLLRQQETAGHKRTRNAPLTRLQYCIRLFRSIIQLRFPRTEHSLVESSSTRTWMPFCRRESPYLHNASSAAPTATTVHHLPLHSTRSAYSTMRIRYDAKIRLNFS